MLARMLRRSRGFTLVELAVVVVIIGVLAAFGVPRFLQSVERSKAAEAFAYLSAVRTAQERYRPARAPMPTTSEARHPVRHAEVLLVRDHRCGSGTTSSLAPGLVDADPDPHRRVGRLRPYTVTFTDRGYDSGNSTINGMDINPMSAS